MKSINNIIYKLFFTLIIKLCSSFLFSSASDQPLIEVNYSAPLSNNKERLYRGTEQPIINYDRRDYCRYGNHRTLSPCSISNTVQSKIAICRAAPVPSNEKYKIIGLSLLDLATSINTLYAPILELKNTPTPVSALHLLNTKTVAIGHGEKIYIFADETNINCWYIIKNFFTYPRPEPIITKKNELTLNITEKDSIEKIDSTDSLLVAISKEGHIFTWSKKNIAIDNQSISTIQCKEPFFSSAINSKNDIICLGLANGNIFFTKITDLASHKIITIFPSLSTKNIKINWISSDTDTLLFGILCNCHKDDKFKNENCTISYKIIAIKDLKNTDANYNDPAIQYNKKKKYINCLYPEMKNHCVREAYTLNNHLITINFECSLDEKYYDSMNIELLPFNDNNNEHLVLFSNRNEQWRFPELFYGDSNVTNRHIVTSGESIHLLVEGYDDHANNSTTIKNNIIFSSEKSSCLKKIYLSLIRHFASQAYLQALLKPEALFPKPLVSLSFLFGCTITLFLLSYKTLLLSYINTFLKFLLLMTS